MDWQGLLKWSITHQDGTVKKDIKEMDGDTRKWLMEAMAEFSLQDVKRMQQILLEVSAEDLGTPEDEQMKVNLLEEIEDIVDSLDMADSLYQIGGLVELIKQAQTSKYPRVQQISLSIFITCNQNSPHVQMWCIAEGAFKFVNLVLNATSEATKEWAISALSSLTRGENLEAKRNFISIDGIEFLLLLLKTPTTTLKMTNKILSMLRDLVFYDERIHFTYNNLSAFANTNAKVVNGKDSSLMKPNNSKSNNNVFFDQNTELLKENEKPENLKFKSIVKKVLIQESFIDQHINLLSNLDNNRFDTRSIYLFILKSLIEYSEEAKASCRTTHIQTLKDAMLATMKNSAKNSGFNDEEVELYKDILTILQKS